MNAAEALAKIRGWTKAGRYVLGRHARQRMEQRRVSERAVVHALTTAGRCRVEDAAADKWRVFGEDLERDELVLIVVLDDGVFLVTLF